MVYSVRTNASFVSHKPLKTKMRESDISVCINNYLKDKKISVQTGSDGVVRVKAVKIQ